MIYGIFAKKRYSDFLLTTCYVSLRAPCRRKNMTHKCGNCFTYVNEFLNGYNFCSPKFAKIQMHDYSNNNFKAYLADTDLHPTILERRRPSRAAPRRMSTLLNQYSPVPRARSSTAGKDATQQREHRSMQA